MPGGATSRPKGSRHEANQAQRHPAPAQDAQAPRRPLPWILHRHLTAWRQIPTKPHASAVPLSSSRLDGFTIHISYSHTTLRSAPAQCYLLIPSSQFQIVHRRRCSLAITHATRLPHDFHRHGDRLPLTTLNRKGKKCIELSAQRYSKTSRDFVEV